MQQIIWGEGGSDKHSMICCTTVAIHVARLVRPSFKDQVKFLVFQILITLR
jgi:hypothetical protein